MCIKLLIIIISNGHRPIGLKLKISINSVRPIISTSGELFGSLKCQAIMKQKNKSGMGTSFGVRLTGAIGNIIAIRPNKEN